MFGCGRRRRRRRSQDGGRGLFRHCLVVRHGGVVVQVGVDEALAASDVVDATDGWVTSVWQRETLLLRNGADSLVAQISVQDVVACQETRQVDSSTTWNNNFP